ncbi:MAG TPA: MBL fold metallo-hydrolase [Allosphingosinicella sp.]|nr:MBL fold metallo-hydrolase [Allosphingosinicella sp.]
MRVRILGCGTSSGVPRVGNDWGECDPANPKNRRRRVSILVEHEGTRILVDTGPDLREQLLDADVSDVSAVIWTHDHADHCHGIDDLRQLFHARGAPVTGYARPATMEVLLHRFDYAFEGKGDYPPVVTIAALPDELAVQGVRIRITDQPHGSVTSTGIRFDADGRSIGYSTDVSGLTGEMKDLFKGVDVWIVGALRRGPHPSHGHLSQVLGWIEEVQPGRAILTHMDQSMDYDGLRAELPANVEPGYDGLGIAL